MMGVFSDVCSKRRNSSSMFKLYKEFLSTPQTSNLHFWCFLSLSASFVTTFPTILRSVRTTSRSHCPIRSQVQPGGGEGEGLMLVRGEGGERWRRQRRRISGVCDTQSEVAPLWL